MSDPTKLDVERYNRNTRAMAEDLWSLTANVRELEKTVRWQSIVIWGLVVGAGVNAVDSIIERLT